MTDKAVITDIVFVQGITSPYYDSNCDQVTDWSGTPTLDGITFIQGTGALSAKISKTQLETVFSLKDVNNINAKIIIIWAMCSGRMDTHPGGEGTGRGVGSGFRTVVYEGANCAEWDIAGRNTWAGGWTAHVVHGITAYSRVVAGSSPNREGITKIGVLWDIVGSASAINVWWDSLRLGTYFGAKGGSSIDPVNFDYLITQDELVANRWGAMYRFEILVFVQSKLKLGSTVNGEETYFKELNEIIIFPNRLVPSDFYEIIVQGNAGASTKVFFGAKSGDSGISGCYIKPSGPKIRFIANDQYITELGLYGSVLSGMDLIQLPASGQGEAINTNFEDYKDIETSTFLIDRCNFISGTGLITAGGGLFTNCAVIASVSAVAMSWNVNVDTDGKLDGTSFVSSGSGHAIELGPNTPSMISFRDIVFTSYGANETANAALYNNSGKEITVNVFGAAPPTVRNGAGASTIIVTEQYTFQFTVVKPDFTPLTGYEWRLYEEDPAPGRIGDEIDGEEYANQATQNYVYPYEGDMNIVVQIMHNDYVESLTYETLIEGNKSITIVMESEENI